MSIQKGVYKFALPRPSPWAGGVVDHTNLLSHVGVVHHTGARAALPLPVVQ